MYTILLVIHSILVVFLIFMVLLQRSDSDGLSGLGGGGGNQFMTGRGAANLMTRTTSILAGAFMLTSLILAIMASRMTAGSILDHVVVPKVQEQTEGKPVEKVSDEKAIEKTAPKAVEKKAIKAPAPVAPAVPKPE